MCLLCCRCCCHLVYCGICLPHSRDAKPNDHCKSHNSKLRCAYQFKHVLNANRNQLNVHQKKQATFMYIVQCQKGKTKEHTLLVYAIVKSIACCFCSIFIYLFFCCHVVVVVFFSTIGNAILETVFKVNENKRPIEQGRLNLFAHRHTRPTDLIELKWVLWD